MKKLLATTILTSMLAIPAFAVSAEEATSCADFMAMDHDGQMEAVHMASMAGDDMMAEDDMASDDMASDDMKSDDMAADDMMEEDDMASDDMMEEDDMASDDMMAEDGMMAEDVAAYCTEHPDMTVADAMMHGNM